MPFPWPGMITSLGLEIRFPKAEVGPQQELVRVPPWEGAQDGSSMGTGRGSSALPIPEHREHAVKVPRKKPSG